MEQTPCCRRRVPPPLAASEAAAGGEVVWSFKAGKGRRVQVGRLGWGVAGGSKANRDCDFMLSDRDGVRRVLSGEFSNNR
jgi:hypothetical protein